MSKSVRERAEEVVLNEYRKTLWGDRVAGRIVDALERAGLLATPALLECGDACIEVERAEHGPADGPAPAGWTAAERRSHRRASLAGRALADERAGAPQRSEERTKPDTSREDAALAEYVLAKAILGYYVQLDERTPVVAACRKAREKKARWTPEPGPQGTWRVRLTTDDGVTGFPGSLTEPQARAVAEALNALEAK